MPRRPLLSSHLVTGPRRCRRCGQLFNPVFRVQRTHPAGLCESPSTPCLPSLRPAPVHVVHVPVYLPPPGRIAWEFLGRVIPPVGTV